MGGYELKVHKWQRPGVFLVCVTHSLTAELGIWPPDEQQTKRVKHTNKVGLLFCSLQTS